MTYISHKCIGAAFAGALALGVAAPTALIFPASPALAAQGDLDRAVTALRSITTMKANFTQTDRKGQTISGVMTLKQPGKIRFQYQNGVPLLVVSNGKTLTLIDYEVNQVQNWPINNSPLGALLDPKRDVAKYGKLVPTGNPNVISVQVRDTGRPEFGMITLIFTRKASAPGGLELSSWVALDSQNNRTTVRLKGHRYGLAVSDKDFTYRDPRRSGAR